MKTTKEQIAEKQKELSDLREKLIIEENEKFKHFIGKYFVLSATSIFRVDKIDYVNQNGTIECTGLSVYGNPKYADDFRIEQQGSGHLYIDEENHEITQELFFKTLDEWFYELRTSFL